MAIRRSRRVALAILVLVMGLPACSAAPSTGDLHMLPMYELPEEMRNAPADVRMAYQFAAANPAVSMNVPCYCGCDSLGHTSNYWCYVSRVEQDGTIVYDRHALACATCVDITLDSMRLLGEGNTVQEIGAYVDSAYSKYGNSNMH
jgi:hypothetical protein